MHHRDVAQSLRSVGDLYSYSMPSSGIAGDLMLIRLHRRGGPSDPASYLLAPFPLVVSICLSRLVSM